MLELLTHLCSLAPSYGTASRTCSDCYKEHDMHHSKPIEDIESLTAKQILVNGNQRPSQQYLEEICPKLLLSWLAAIQRQSALAVKGLWDGCIPLVGEEKRQHRYSNFLQPRNSAMDITHQQLGSYQVKSNLDSLCLFFPMPPLHIGTVSRISKVRKPGGSNS